MGVKEEWKKKFGNGENANNSVRTKEKPPNFIRYLAQKQREGKYDIIRGGIGGLIDEYRSHQEMTGQAKEKYTTYESITAGARITQEYLVLLVLSCLIATMGLIQNSPAIIIGAMIVSPLMNPIFAFSAGVLWGNLKVITGSVLTLLLGTVIVLGLTSLLASTIPGILATPEMLARTNPSVYDIMVAVCCGLVGAYGNANTRISNALAGVAISVALMPPLSTAGIGIGLGDVAMFRGALLLFAINLLGISLAAVVVFYLVRLKPHLADSKEAARIRRRVFSQVLVSVLAIAVVSGPMIYFMQSQARHVGTNKLIDGVVREGLAGQKVFSIEVAEQDGELNIDVVLLKKSPLEREKLKALEEKLKTGLKRKFRLNLFPVEPVRQ